MSPTCLVTENDGTIGGYRPGLLAGQIPHESLLMTETEHGAKRNTTLSTKHQGARELLHYKPNRIAGEKAVLFMPGAPMDPKPLTSIVMILDEE